MKLINNSKGVKQYNILTNPNERIEDDEGRSVRAKPVTKLIHIPNGVEVELEDADWKAMISAKTRIQEYTELRVPVKETAGAGLTVGTNKDDTKEAYIIQHIPTGSFKTVSLVLKDVENGTLTVVEQPKLELSRDEVVEAIAKVGITVSDDIPNKELKELYYKVAV